MKCRIEIHKTLGVSDSYFFTLGRSNAAYFYFTGNVDLYTNINNLVYLVCLVKNGVISASNQTHAYIVQRKVNAE